MCFSTLNIWTGMNVNLVITSWRSFVFCYDFLPHFWKFVIYRYPNQSIYETKTYSATAVRFNYGRRGWPQYLLYLLWRVSAAKASWLSPHLLQAMSPGVHKKGGSERDRVSFVPTETESGRQGIRRIDGQFLRVFEAPWIASHYVLRYLFWKEWAIAVHTLCFKALRVL